MAGTRLRRGTARVVRSAWSLRAAGAVCLWAASAGGQTTAPGADARAVAAMATLPAEQSGPLQRWNAGMFVAGVHDSASGWYEVATPLVSYSTGVRFSADVSVPLYIKRQVLEGDHGDGRPEQFAESGADLGDTLLEAHVSLFPRSAVNTLTGLLGIPTGAREDGLGTGRTTFNVDDRLDHYVRGADLFADVGAGDASGIVNRQVTEDATSLGPSAQFQLGMVRSLPRKLLLESFAYEQLPLGDQKTYATFATRGGPTRTVATGRRVLEDNGLNVSVYLPLSAHVTLSGGYNRSLRLHLDTVSTGIAFVWKGTPAKPQESLIDKAMAEAERGLAADATTSSTKPPE